MYSDQKNKEIIDFNAVTDSLFLFSLTIRH